MPQRRRKSREWRFRNFPKTEQHIPTADIDGTDSRMEQARASKRIFFPEVNQVDIFIDVVNFR